MANKIRDAAGKAAEKVEEAAKVLRKKVLKPVGKVLKPVGDELGPLLANVLRKGLGAQTSMRATKNPLESYVAAAAKYTGNSEKIAKAIPDEKTLKENFDKTPTIAIFEPITQFKDLIIEHKNLFHNVFEITPEANEKIRKFIDKITAIKNSKLPPDAMLEALIRLKKESAEVFKQIKEDAKNKLDSSIKNEMLHILDEEKDALKKELTKKLDEEYKKFEKTASEKLIESIGTASVEANKAAARLSLLYELYNNNAAMRHAIGALNKDKSLIISQDGKQYDPFGGVDLSQLKEMHHKNAYKITNNGNTLSIEINPGIIGGVLDKYRGIPRLRQSMIIVIAAMKAQGYDKLTVNISQANEDRAKETAQIAFHEAVRQGFDPEKIEFVVNGKPMKGHEIFANNPNVRSEMIAEGKKIQEDLKKYREENANLHLEPKDENPEPKAPASQNNQP